MAKQTINIGTSELAGDGESLRSAWDKVNDNFDEVYSDIATLDGSKIVYGDLSVTTASASGSGSLTYDSSTGTFTFTPAVLPTVPTDVSELTDTTDLLNHFSGDYNDLTNKPTIPTVPTAVSAFTNDSGYITGYTVTESDVTAHQSALTITQSQISDLSHFSGDYNDLTNKPTIPIVPTAISAFTNDSGYITDYTITSADVTAHQANLSITESQISDLSHFSKDYNDLTNKPLIQTDFAPAFVSGVIFTPDDSTGSIRAGWIYGSHPSGGSRTLTLSAEQVDIRALLNRGDILYLHSITDPEDGIGTAGYIWSNQTKNLLIGAGGNTGGKILYLRGNSLEITTDAEAPYGTPKTWKFNSTGTITFPDTTTQSTAWTGTVTESQISDLGSYVESDTTGITGADQVTNMVTLTQAEYDAIGTPNVTTVYIIVG